MRPRQVTENLKNLRAKSGPMAYFKETIYSAIMASLNPVSIRITSSQAVHSFEPPSFQSTINLYDDADLGPIRYQINQLLKLRKGLAFTNTSFLLE